jgi:hypothetical protein
MKESVGKFARLRAFIAPPSARRIPNAIFITIRVYFRVPFHDQ